MNLKISNYRIIALLLVLLIIAGQVPWIIWDFLWIRGLLNILVFIMSLYFLKYTTRKKILTLGVILTLLSYFLVYNSFDHGTITLYFIIVAVVIIPNELKAKTILLLNKVICYILIPGILLYVLYLIGFNLPHTQINASWKDNLTYQNYYLFIIKGLSFYRFNSLFDEPGTLGTFLAFLLAINRFEINKRNILFFIVGLSTLSIAFIIMCFVGFLLNNIKFSIKKLFSIVVTSSIVFTIILVIPALKENILPRLEFKNGEFTGNNRTSNKTNEYFSTFIESNDAFYGLGGGSYLAKTKDRVGNSSYKIFIMDYGFIGAIILFLIYLMLMPKNPNKQIINLFILFFISFLQRPYALTPWQVFLFSSGIAYLNYTKNELIFLKRSNAL